MSPRQELPHRSPARQSGCSSCRANLPDNRPLLKPLAPLHAAVREPQGADAPSRLPPSPHTRHRQLRHLPTAAGRKGLGTGCRKCVSSLGTLAARGKGLGRTPWWSGFRVPRVAEFPPASPETRRVILTAVSLTYRTEAREVYGYDWGCFREAQGRPAFLKITVGVARGLGP